MKNLSEQLKALDNFTYTDTRGKTDKHFKKLPLKSKKLFLKILKKHHLIEDLRRLNEN